MISFFFLVFFFCLIFFLIHLLFQNKFTDCIFGWKPHRGTQMETHNFFFFGSSQFEGAEYKFDVAFKGFISELLNLSKLVLKLKSIQIYLKMCVLVNLKVLLIWSYFEWLHYLCTPSSPEIIKNYRFSTEIVFSHNYSHKRLHFICFAGFWIHQWMRLQNTC